MGVGEIEEGSPVGGGDGVAAGVIVEAEAAGDQRGVERREFGCAEEAPTLVSS